MSEQMPPLPGFQIVKPFTFPAQPYEYKVTALRECPTPESLALCDTPQKVADYWRLHVPSHPYFSAECECFVVLMLNTRRRVKGHYLVSVGTQDTILVHPREVFRLAIMTAAAAIVMTLAARQPRPKPTLGLHATSYAPGSFLKSKCLTISLSATRTIHRSASLAIFCEPMTRTKRRLPILQHEFGFVPDTFTLIQEIGQDGERLARERDEANRARRHAEAAQPALFNPAQGKH